MGGNLQRDYKVLYPKHFVHILKMIENSQLSYCSFFVSFCLNMLSIPFYQRVFGIRLLYDFQPRLFYLLSEPYHLSQPIDTLPVEYILYLKHLPYSEQNLIQYPLKASILISDRKNICQGQLEQQNDYLTQKTIQHSHHDKTHLLQHLLLQQIILQCNL